MQPLTIFGERNSSFLADLFKKHTTTTLNTWEKPTYIKSMILLVTKTLTFLTLFRLRLLIEPPQTSRNAATPSSLSKEAHILVLTAVYKSYVKKENKW